MSRYERERAVAAEAVRRAARLTRAVQAELEPGVLSKQDKSPVTVADFGSQALVCRALREAFPDDPIVAEETSGALREDDGAAIHAQVVERVRAEEAEASEEDVLAWIDYGNGDGRGDRFWTLDPIDGTRGFLRGDQYAVALALIEGGEVVVAALGCPNLGANTSTVDPHGTLYVAVRGEGATQEPLGRSAPTVAVDVSPVQDATRARFCESVESRHSDQSASANVARRLGIAVDPVRIDSQCKYALVARGGAEVYMRLPTRPGYMEKIWDHAAGLLVVEEAGGRVTDVEGKPLDFTHGDGLAKNRGVIATNGPLHGRVLEAVAAEGV